MNKQNKQEAAIHDWVLEHHPTYTRPDWRVRSFAWEYDLCALPSEMASRLSEKIYQRIGDNLYQEDFDDLVETVEPPEGYIYITLQNDKESKRVGFNVPETVFNKG